VRRPDDPPVTMHPRSCLLAEAAVLEGVVDRLDAFAESIPEEDDDATPAGEMSDDVLSFMAGAARCTADENLRPAIAQLRRAAAVTSQELRRLFDGIPRR